MAANYANEVPIGMRRVCRRFEYWRSGHKARLLIPNALWKAAVQTAREHGIFGAAKTLRLDYTRLKRVMEFDCRVDPGAVAQVRGTAAGRRDCRCRVRD